MTTQVELATERGDERRAMTTSTHVFDRIVIIVTKMLLVFITLVIVHGILADNCYYSANNILSDMRIIFQGIANVSNKASENMRVGINQLEVQMNQLKVQIGQLEVRMGQVEVRMGKVEVRMGQVEVRMDQLEVRMDQLEVNMTSAIANSEQRIIKSRYDHDSLTVVALSKVPIVAEVCRSNVTAHYVLYKDRMFGVSIAHTLCYANLDVVPSFVRFCENLDVSLWTGCPPATASLLNITSRTTRANLGDTATIFGFANGSRIWKGSIVSFVGQSYIGRHMTPKPSEHEEELVFQGAQERGMSGGGAINSAGYLGVARAVPTGWIGNKLPTITPIHLFEGCIDKYLDDFSKFGDCANDHQEAYYNEVVPVPTMNYY